MTPPRDHRRPSKQVLNAGLQNRQNRRIALAGCGLVANVQNPQNIIENAKNEIYLSKQVQKLKL